MNVKILNNSSKIVQRPDCNRKDFENYSKLKGVTKKDVEDLVEIRLNQINDAKLKTIADLKKEYEDKISGEKEYFENEEGFYSVALHEMAHSTGHESRLVRFETGVAPTTKSYAREELVAEFSSMFLQQELGIKVTDNEKHFDNHKAYLRHYIEILERDPNELFKAINRAELAAERVIEMGKEKEIDRENSIIPKLNKNKKLNDWETKEEKEK